MMKENNFLWWSLLIGIFILSFVGANFYWNNKFEKLNLKIQNQEKIIQKQKQIIKEKKEIEKKKIKVIENNSLNLKTKAFLVYNLDKNKVLLEKNSQKLLPIASLTKITNAIVALEKFPENYQIKILPQGLKVWGNYGFIQGEKFNLKDAIKIMLVGSVNDMAASIALNGKNNYSQNWLDFINRMNQKVNQIGTQDTIFFTETGLNVNNRIMGAYSTPKDLSKIVQYFIKTYPEISKETSKYQIKICSNLKCHSIINTNPLTEKYKNILFSKTGYTQKAGGSLIIVVNQKNQKIIYIILGSTKEGRFQDFEKLYNFVEKNNLD